jgi:hypothetical protein
MQRRFLRSLPHPPWPWKPWPLHSSRPGPPPRRSPTMASLRRTRVRVVAEAAPRRPLLAAAAGWMGYYMVLVDAAPSGITRPLVQILCDLNKRVPVTIVIPASRCASASDPVVPWYSPSLSLIAVQCCLPRDLVNARSAVERYWRNSGRPTTH